MTSGKEMTKGEREELKRLARERSRLAKLDAKSRTADLKAGFEHEVATVWEYDRDDVWKAAVKAANEAVEKAQEIIADRCVELGIPRELAPRLAAAQWVGRGQHALNERRQELRRAAYTQIEATERTAIHEIETKALEVQTQLVRAGLTSDAAIGFLDEMPSVDALMPAIDLVELDRNTGRGGRPPRGLPPGDDDGGLW